MVPMRVLIVGAEIPVLHQIHDTLDREGYLATVATPGPAPSLILSRHLPDLVILDAEPRLGRWDSWSRAIRSYRTRRPLSALVVVAEPLEAADRRDFEETADLGLVPRPVDLVDLAARLEDWYHDQTPIPGTGTGGDR